MLAKVIWKGAMFAFSIFMLLLVMGYGSGGASLMPKQDTHTRLPGQAKIAAPGARMSGFQSVAPRPEPVVLEPSLFAKIREATDRWLIGGNMHSLAQAQGPKPSELQQWQRRRGTQGVPGGMSVLKAY